jgi:hypothetical protein
MRRTRISLVLILALALSSLACQTTANLIATPTPTASITPSVTATATITSTPTRTPRPTKTFTPTPTPLVIKVDHVRKVASGGFNYGVLDGLEKEANNHEVYMYSEDEKLSIYLAADVPFPGEHIHTSLRYYMEWANEEYREVVESDRENITQDGVEGVSKFFSALTDDGEPFQARVTFLSPERSKRLLILVYAYGEGAWETFGEEAYQATLESISFFEITPWEACPVSTRSSYGYSKENPIKLGGALLLGPDRAEEYMSALLGGKGEVVFYYRSDTVEVNGTTLDVYIIRVGSQTKTLYVDINHYDTIKAPAGMTCSGPLPMALWN